MNVADRCPSTAEGEKVDQHGCGPGQLDADSDGVADAQDQCPNTVIGELVDPRGCGRDADGDKVPDVADRCPDTPNGQAVDENGCPSMFQQGAQARSLCKGSPLQPARQRSHLNRRRRCRTWPNSCRPARRCGCKSQASPTIPARDRGTSRSHRSGPWRWRNSWSRTEYRRHS